MAQKEELKEPQRAGGAAVDLEAVLAREAGQLGWYQARVLLLCACAAAFFAFATHEYTFTTGRIPTRCLIPECEQGIEPSEREFEPAWLDSAVPRAGGGFDNCRRFANASFGDQHQDTCPASLFDQSTVLTCDEYVYANSDTAVYTLGLACDEWRRSLLGSSRTLGALLSLPLAGALSDRWGRRTALAIVSFNSAWIGILRVFASTYVGFLISVFCESLFGAGAILSCAYILGVEMVPAKHRIAAGALVNSASSLGAVTVGLLAWALPNWKHLTLALYAPQFLTLFYLWIFPESVRWSLSKGRFAEAEVVLEKIAKSRGKELSEKLKLELREAAAAAIRTKEQAPKEAENEPWLIVLVFRHKPILLRCIVTPVWWITLTLIYYGLAVNAVNISGNAYVNFMTVAAADIPGFCSAVFVMKYFGRKPTLIMYYWICGLCQLGYIFLPSEQYALSLAVYLIGKFSISAVGSTMYVYTSELFPTRYRHRLFGYASMTGRIGSIVAPLTPALGSQIWEPLPFVLFGALALVSGLLVLLTPETRGCPLPDTMQDAADMGRRPRDLVSRL